MSIDGEESLRSICFDSEIGEFLWSIKKIIYIYIYIYGLGAA